MNLKMELMMIKREIKTLSKKVKKIIVDVEKFEKSKSVVEVFDFKNKWYLVEPHLNDPHILFLLDACMERFCIQYKYHTLPDWDRGNGIGPWVYSIGDGHSQEILDKVNEDPELQIISEKYYNIGKTMGFYFDNPVEFIDFIYQNKDPKIIAIRDSYQEESYALDDKYSPKPNTYKWYQCFGACFFLAEWQEALAKKVFPNFKWLTIQNRIRIKPGGNEHKAGHSTTIGIGSKGEKIIFDILLFEKSSLDKILDAAGVDLTKL